MKSFLGKINNKLNEQGGFLKAISLLMGGTAFAHVITILALPFITHLYSPDEFSKLAVYSSLLGIFSVIACLRYDIAIPLPESEKVGRNLLIISLINSVLFVLLLALILFSFSDQIKLVLGNGYSPQLIWLLPLGVGAASLYSAFKFWITRLKEFKVIAVTKIQQSTSSVIAQILLAWLGYTSIGLLIGQFFYNSAGIFSLVKASKNKILWRGLSFQEIKKTYKDYIRFPKYSVGEALFNTAGIQIPILIIASVTASQEAGYLLLASKIMIVPMVLIGASVSQVYYAHANEAKHKGCLEKFTYNCLKKLAIIGTVPLLIIGILAPKFFPIVFGAEWGRAGVLVAWMTPWFIMQFIVSPISMVLHISNAQRLAILLQLFGLFLKLAIIYMAFKLDLKHISEWYAISGFIFYILYLFTIVKILKKPSNYGVESERNNIFS